MYVSPQGLCIFRKTLYFIIIILFIALIYYTNYIHNYQISRLYKTKAYIVKILLKSKLKENTLRI